MTWFLFFVIKDIMENAKSVQAKKQYVSPLPGYITLKLIEPETKTASGLEIPDTSQEKPQMGTVLAMGKILKEEIILENCENSLEAVKMLEIQSSIKAGDTVAFKKYTCQVVKIADEEIQIVEFKDLLGVIKDGS